MDSSDDSDSDMERGSSRSRDRKSEHKMPRWNGAKESFDDCWYKASAYLDAENLLETAMGKDIGNATDSNKRCEKPTKSETNAFSRYGLARLTTKRKLERH